VTYVNEAGLLLIENSEWREGVNQFFRATGRRIWPFLHKDIIKCLSAEMGAACRFSLEGHAEGACPIHCVYSGKSYTPALFLTNMAMNSSDSGCKYRLKAVDKFFPCVGSDRKISVGAGSAVVYLLGTTRIQHGYIQEGFGPWSHFWSTGTGGETLLGTDKPSAPWFKAGLND
jgi:hypothetical protein